MSSHPSQTKKLLCDQMMRYLSKKVDAEILDAKIRGDGPPFTGEELASMIEVEEAAIEVLKDCLDAASVRRCGKVGGSR